MMIEKIESDWASWLGGFVDGEGYFQLMPYRNRTGYNACLVIVLREDDESILREIQTTLKCGNITWIHKAKHDRKHHLNSANQFMWRCCKINDISKIIIPLFDQFPLRTKKKNDYFIWRRAALLIKNGGNKTQLQKLHQLKNQLVQQRRLVKSCPKEETVIITEPQINQLRLL